MPRFPSLTALRRVSIIHAVNGTSRGARGFTLIELLVVISVLGTILAFFVPTIVGRITTNARRVATLQEMRMLHDAIAGNPDVTMGGEMVVTGFKNDVGRWPRNLVELATKNPFDPPWSAESYPGKETLSNWDPYLKKGWNGPYVREDGNMGYLDDAWGTAYRFDVSASSETLGLRSAGADQLFFRIDPGANDSDDVWVKF
jgi:prepilin-type N-terminal cleavage/methylation domain-containing protein